MRTAKLLAWTQIVFGLVGLIFCVVAFQAMTPAAQNWNRRMEDLASGGELQAQTSLQFLDDMRTVAASVDQTLQVHDRGLQELENGTQQLVQLSEHWNRSLSSFADTATQASNICRRASTHLPINVPTVETDEREIAFQVPDIDVREKTVQLPYPTASLGSRRRSINVGITDVTIDVPSIDLGRANLSVKVPQAEITKRTERITVPDNFRLTNRKFFNAEKQLLDSVADDLREGVRLLDETQNSLQQARDFLGNELPASLAATRGSVAETRAALQRVEQTQIPAAQERVTDFMEELTRAQSEVERSMQLLPWLLGILLLFPAGSLLNGISNLLQLSTNSEAE